MAELAAYDNDPTLYLFTSLTAGSSHIITATSRIETILKANKIPFRGVDTATDDLARKLYGRRARGKKLPLLVKEGYVIADLEQVEEWNEYGELREALGAPAPAPASAKPANTTTAAPANQNQKENVPARTPDENLAIRTLGAEAAAMAAAKKAAPPHISTTNPLLASKPAAPGAGVVSPSSVPLPDTPAGEAAKSLQNPSTEFHGRKVESPDDEEIKLVERQSAILEGEEEGVQAEPQTQAQDAKDGDKAGVSVKD